MTDEPARLAAAAFNRVADLYEELEDPAAPWPRLRRHEELLARGRAGAALLDAGCGNGLPALAAIARRHRALGLDVSREQVARARRNVPEAEVHEADLAGASIEPGT